MYQKEYKIVCIAKNQLSWKGKMALRRSHPDKKSLFILQALCYLNKKQRLILLRAADKKIIRSICECALNLLKGNIKISEGQKRLLQRHKLFLRKLACVKRRSWLAKKKLLIQKGSGILPFLLQPIIAALIAGVFQK